jgi:hypothetical protein
MKTAMMELIEAVNQHYSNPLRGDIFDTNPFLEKEKEQIINAYDNGYKACDLDEALEINKTMFSGDTYYKETYNKNK